MCCRLKMARGLPSLSSGGIIGVDLCPALQRCKRIHGPAVGGGTACLESPGRYYELLEIDVDAEGFLFDGRRNNP